MKYPSNLIFVFYCRQIRIGNRYHEQLGDDLQILLAFYFLSLGDFGISPRICKLIWYYPQGCFTLWRDLYILMIFVIMIILIHGRTRIWSSNTDWSRIWCFVTALASQYINILFHVVYINLYMFNDYFRYLNHVQMI